MKVLALFVSALALIALVLWHPVFKNQNSSQNPDAISLPAPVNPKLEKIDSSSPPPGFVGPSSPPHVIGPSGPPPGS